MDHFSGVVMGRKVAAGTIESARQLETLALSSIGPGGRLKILRSEIPSIALKRALPIRTNAHWPCARKRNAGVCTGDNRLLGPSDDLFSPPRVFCLSQVRRRRGRELDGVAAVCDLTDWAQLSIVHHAPAADCGGAGRCRPEQVV